MAALVAAVLLAMPTSSGAAAPADVGVVGPDVLVRPADAPATAPVGRLLVAGNEFESLQVVVRAGAGPVTGVDVRVAGTATAPDGSTLPASAFTVYRVGYYTVAGHASDGELGGALGAFPDMLVPAVDPVWGEPRRAFPIDVPAGENRLAWIDVLAPAAARAGIYSGASIVVTADGGVTRSIPLEIEVIDLTLPSTTSLDGGFDINTNKLCGGDAHDCTAFPGGWSGVAAMYERVALDNRLTIAKPPSAEPAWPADASYVARTRPLILGTAATRLQGARLRTVTIFQWSRDSADEWRRHAEADGFVDRVRFHCDEVATSATMWSACRSDWNHANSLWRGAASGTPSDLPLQVTTTLDQVEWARANGFADIADRIAILVPVVNGIHPKRVASFPGLRPQYATWLGERTAGGLERSLWTYTSCMSMGCSPAAADDHPEWIGWPSYGIDQPASQARATSWLAFTYGIAGEYYYDVTRDLQTSSTTLWSEGGGNHGDGTLFYPGRTDRIGGSHDVALESIRLKRIRDGREDYEWLRVAASTGGREDAVRIARGLYPTAFQTTVSQTQIDAARVQLATLVSGRVPRSTDPVGGGPGTTGPGGTRPGGTRPSRLTCGGRRVTIRGTARGELLRGTRGNDVIAGLGGNDRILGFGGADVICGGAGNDAIVTWRDGRRRDVVVCGAGRDVVAHDRGDRLYRGCERRRRGR